jgi:hypothetical protein
LEEELLFQYIKKKKKKFVNSLHAKTQKLEDVIGRNRFLCLETEICFPNSPFYERAFDRLVLTHTNTAHTLQGTLRAENMLFATVRFCLEFRGISQIPGIWVKSTLNVR